MLFAIKRRHSRKVQSDALLRWDPQRCERSLSGGRGKPTQTRRRPFPTRLRHAHPPASPPARQPALAIWRPGRLAGAGQGGRRKAEALEREPQCLAPGGSQKGGVGRITRAERLKTTARLGRERPSCAPPP
ncbi:unnamed protein product [Lampetra planeri]